MADKRDAVPRKLYSKEFLETKTISELRGFCKKRRIPSARLTKPEIIENIICWGKGEAPPNKVNNLDKMNPVKNPDIRMNIRIRNFCFEYANVGKTITSREWGKRYNCSESTISQWLARENVKELILQFQKSREARVEEIFAKHEEDVVLNLVGIATQRKNTDVKRKSINDFLGYRGKVNVNKQRAINLNQSQGQLQGQLQQSVLTNLTDEELDKKIKELEDLE